MVVARSEPSEQSTIRGRPRIGLFTPRFELFDEAMPVDFRAGRERAAARAAELLGGRFDVDHPGLVERHEDAVRVADRWTRDPALDAVVCWPTMAAPPAWLEAVLDARPDLGVVVVVAQESSVVGVDYDTDEATERSLPVGAVMATNVLRRRGTPFEVIVGRDDERLAEHIGAAVLVLATVAAVRRLRLGVIGEPIEGYSDVMVASAELAALGVTVIDVAEEFEREVVEADRAAVAEVVREVASRGEVRAEVDVVERSARVAVALDRVVVANRLDGGAVNCHGPRFRFGDAVGVTGCLAVSRCTTQGQPFACTGDLPAAIALVLGQRLAGAALYCELYQLDLERNWVLVANGGEGDWSVRDPERPLQFLPEDHYRGVRGAGLASAFAISRGPSTLLSMSPAIGPGGQWGIVVAEGEILGSEHERMEGPNGMFRFADLEVAPAYAEWCREGASHHAVLLPGLHAGALRQVGRHLDVDVRVLTGGTMAGAR